MSYFQILQHLSGYGGGDAYDRSDPQNRRDTRLSGHPQSHHQKCCYQQS